MRIQFPKLAGLASLVLLAAAAPPARGCSICRCGDPTFNALGTDVYKEGAFRISLDWERFDKEQGNLPEDGAAALARAKAETGADLGREAVVENRFTTGFSYTFGERVVAVARIPWSTRQMSQVGGPAAGADSEGGPDQSRDLADPDLYALVRLWSSDFTGGLGRRAWISAVGGVKTAWGKSDLTSGGVRLDEHLQPGTGATDTFGGFRGSTCSTPAPRSSPPPNFGAPAPTTSITSTATPRWRTSATSASWGRSGTAPWSSTSATPASTASTRRGPAIPTPGGGCSTSPPAWSSTSAAGWWGAWPCRCRSTRISTAISAKRRWPTSG